MEYKQKYIQYKCRIDDHLKRFLQKEEPRSLYDPVRYVLAGGGKRIRPVLLLLSCEAVGGRAQRALHAAAAIEILHNFTLVHDDIMDNALSRRGRPTVHTRWDTDTAILVGDELLALAYRVVLQTRSPRIREIVACFTDGVVEVCEGQAYDKEFETRSDVSVPDYILMITKKTAKMVAVAAEIGALIGDGTHSSIRALRRYGEYVGRAFQIQDDMLDIVADEKKLGKAIGGDLMEGKKTFLLLEALRRAKGIDKALLRTLVKNGGISRRLIPKYRRIYYETGVIAAARIRIGSDIARAKEELCHLPPTSARAMLAWLADMLLNRTY